MSECRSACRCRNADHVCVLEEGHTGSHYNKVCGEWWSDKCPASKDPYDYRPLVTNEVDQLTREITRLRCIIEAAQDYIAADANWADRTGEGPYAVVKRVRDDMRRMLDTRVVIQVSFVLTRSDYERLDVRQWAEDKMVSDACAEGFRATNSDVVWTAERLYPDGPEVMVGLLRVVQ